MTLLERFAMWFAFIAHYSTKHSRRRKYTGELYFTHLQEVVELLGAVGCDKHVKAAGWLHDTVEDVWWVTHWMIRILFGSKVSTLVREVTQASKPYDGNRAFRKKIDLNHFCRASYDGQTLKYADTVSNLLGILECTTSFRSVYMNEKKHLLLNMKSGNHALQKAAFGITLDYFKEEKNALHLSIMKDMRKQTMKDILNRLRNPSIQIVDINPDMLKAIDELEAQEKKKNESLYDFASIVDSVLGNPRETLTAAQTNQEKK